MVAPEKGHSFVGLRAIGKCCLFLVLTSTLLQLLSPHIPLASANALKKSKSVLCADEKCELLYGKGRTLTKYPSPDKDILGFKKDVPVLIYGKTEDSKHFYVEINKSRGLVPTKHVQEESIQNPDLTFKVDLGESIHNQQLPPSPPLEQQLDSSASATDNNDDHQQPSPEIGASSTGAETPGLAGAPPSPINNQPDPGQETGGFASKSATVIEGTTFYDDGDLLKTATPSPTYSAGAVTKTATVEVNFAGNELKHQQPAAPSEEVVPVDIAASKGEGGASGEEVATTSPTIDTEMKGKVLNLLKTSLEKGANASTATLQQNKSSEQLEANPSVVSEESASALASKKADDATSNVTAELVVQSAAETAADAESALKVEEKEKTQPAETPVSEEAAQQSENDAPLPMVENVAAENASAVEEQPQVSTELEQPKSEEEKEKTAERSPVENAQTSETEENVNSLLSENAVNEEKNSNDVDAHEVPPVVQNRSVEIPAATENHSTDQQLPVDSAAPVEKVAPAVEAKVVEEEEKIPEEPKLGDDSPAVPPPILPPLVPQTVEHHHQQQPVISANSSLPPQMGNGREPVVPHYPHHPSPPSPSSFQAEAKMIPPSGEQQLSVGQHPHLHQPPPPAWRSSAQYQTTTPPPAPSSEEALQATHQQIQPQTHQQQENLNFASHNPHSAHHQQQQTPHHHQPPPPPPKLSDFVNSASTNQAVPAPAPTSDSTVPASFPASDALIDPVEYATGPEAVVNTTTNKSRRKLLAERVAFVGVIMDIIPDEVELFFENLNVSMHAIVFTSIIAIFWSFTKVLTSFVNSSRKQGELRDITCQVQRKIFYFEAEKDKVKEEAQTAKEMLQVREGEIRTLELRRSRLEHENEALKAERARYTSEIESLRGRASEASQNSSRLNTTLDDLSRLQQEKQDLELLNEELAVKVARLEEEKLDLNQVVESLGEKNRKLTAKSRETAAETETLLGRLKEAEQSCALLQAETQSLQSTKITLHEELRNLKDDLLAVEERCGELTETVQLQTAALAAEQAKVSALVGELDKKNADLASMQLLLSRLNKEVSQKEKAESAAAQRRRLSSQQSTEQQLNGIQNTATALDDALNGNVGGGDVEISSSAATKADEDELMEEEEDETSVADLQDIVKLQLRLTNTELEKGALEAKIKTLEAALESSKMELAALRRTNASLKEETEAAGRERLKAVTELEVLSKYYKEKELEYGKEIGVQRVKREQREEDASSLEGQLRTLEEEAESLKERLKSTKKELEETERRYRGQLNALEKQSHENWIAARNAERKYEESKAEATALRQTLTLSVKSPPPSDVLSLSGFLFDDSASSVSDHSAYVSGHHLHNSSLGGPPGGLPPPPPPPPLMMLNPLAMGSGGGHHISSPMYGGMGDTTGDPSTSGFWSNSNGQQSSSAAAPSYSIGSSFARSPPPPGGQYGSNSYSLQSFSMPPVPSAPAAPAMSTAPAVSTLQPQPSPAPASTVTETMSQGTTSLPPQSSSVASASQSISSASSESVVRSSSLAVANSFKASSSASESQAPPASTPAFTMHTSNAASLEVLPWQWPPMVAASSVAGPPVSSATTSTSTHFPPQSSIAPSNSIPSNPYAASANLRYVSMPGSGETAAPPMSFTMPPPTGAGSTVPQPFSSTMSGHSHPQPQSFTSSSSGGPPPLYQHMSPYGGMPYSSSGNGNGSYSMTPPPSMANISGAPPMSSQFSAVPSSASSLYGPPPSSTFSAPPPSNPYGSMMYSQTNASTFNPSAQGSTVPISNTPANIPPPPTSLAYQQHQHQPSSGAAN